MGRERKKESKEREVRNGGTGCLMYVGVGRRVVRTDSNTDTDADTNDENKIKNGWMDGWITLRK